MQQNACWTRRGAGGAEFVQGNGYLAAAYLHRSSRNGDPQLHTHVLIANATRGPDGKWTRLYHPAIYEHAKTAGYLYEANLRHELSRRLGVEWQAVRNGIAEIEGFADSHLREFSTRRAEILEAAGPDASARARQVATLTTRQGKEHELSTRDDARALAGQGEEIGLDREAIEATFGAEVDLQAKLTLDQLDRQVTAHASHFDRRDAIQAVAEPASQRRSGARGRERSPTPSSPPMPWSRYRRAPKASASPRSASGSLSARRWRRPSGWQPSRAAQAGELIAARVIQSPPDPEARPARDGPPPARRTARASSS